MLRYVYEHHDVVAHFVAQMIPYCRMRGFGKCKAIGVVKNNSLIAGMIYHNWSPETGVIEITGAALPRSGWLTRETIARCYGYPFLGAGVQMVIQRVPADNERLLRQLAAGNFSFIAVPRMFGRDRDGVLCCLTDDAWAECKFNPQRRELPAIEEAA